MSVAPNHSTPISHIPAISIPTVRRLFPQLMAHSLVGVQPMTAPVGMAFAIKSRYSLFDVWDNKNIYVWTGNIPGSLISVDGWCNNHKINTESSGGSWWVDLVPKKIHNVHFDHERKPLYRILDICVLWDKMDKHRQTFRI